MPTWGLRRLAPLPPPPLPWRAWGKTPFGVVFCLFFRVSPSREGATSGVCGCHRAGKQGSPGTGTATMDRAGLSAGLGHGRQKPSALAWFSPPLLPSLLQIPARPAGSAQQPAGSFGAHPRAGQRGGFGGADNFSPLPSCHKGCSDLRGSPSRWRSLSISGCWRHGRLGWMGKPSRAIFPG